ncbi:TetR/AcrR family transcriptional regulator [Natronoglycomyces albus]|uniref:TetR/AcrR family transcriptional regulator n=1 Tax=Natronoglycomyces albus TaxID=2811108 RepID=UPI001FE4D0AB|nr:TetR/AcrR family transcriptional regulator [Natronoglycomyces albus]
MSISEPAPHPASANNARGSKRRQQILDVAIKLLARHGYHGVSMDDIGAAANITGPALYHHFKGGKEQMLAEALIPVSERMLAGGKQHSGGPNPPDPAAALEALVNFHVSFAVESPEVIVLHLHELDRLPEEPRKRVRKLQRAYVEEWVGLLCRLRPGLKPEEARVLAHGAFGLMNSTPWLALRDEVTPEDTKQLLCQAALAALAPK